MPHSPDEAADAPKEYTEGWAAMYELIREGKSWSGRERHNCFLNTGNRRFADISTVAGLDFIDDGRGLAVVDWDHDGALDFWTTNRTGPRVRFLRNLGKSGNHFLAVRLEGTTSNRDAIGAALELHLEGRSDRRLVRTLQAGDAYLAQSSKWVHFGLGDATEIDRLVVRWPGGEEESFRGLEADRRYRLVQGSGQSEPWQPPRKEVNLAASPLPAPVVSNPGRTFLAARLPLRKLSFVDERGARVPLMGDGRPLLVSLWASWCPHCRQELTEFQREAGRIRKSGARMLVLSVEDEDERDEARKFLADLGWEFESGYAEEDLLDVLSIFRQTIVDQARGMVLPTSYLIDAEHQLAAIYRGPTGLDTVLGDIERLGQPPERIRDLAAPFPGRWVAGVPVRSMETLSNVLRSRGYNEIALAYLGQMEMPETAPDWAKGRRAESQENLGIALAKEGKHREAVEAFAKGLEAAPGRPSLHSAIGRSLTELGRLDQAIEHHSRAIELAPDDCNAHFDLGMAYVLQNRLDEGAAQFRLAVELCAPEEESHYRGLYNLGVVHGSQGRPDEAITTVRRALDLRPDFFDALRYLGIMQQQTERIPEAIATYERALEVQPDDAMTVFYLGTAYVQSGDHLGATRQYERLRELGHASADRLRGLIDATGG